MEAWLDDQRMAHALGQPPAEGTPPDELAKPPTRWVRQFVRALAAELTGHDSPLPEDCTWDMLAAEARTKIVNQPGHLQPAGAWLDARGMGYFSKWARCM